MNGRDRAREALIEEVTSAWRPRSRRGLGILPAWLDLEPEGRREAFEQTFRLRELEAALDPEGQSTTVKAVLRRIAAE